MKTPKEFREAIEEYARNRNDEELNRACDELIISLYRTKDPFPAVEAEWILFSLRSNLYFDAMQKVGDAFIQTGRGTFTIYRQYGQALIEQNNFFLATIILNDMVDKTRKGASDAEKKEFKEALGLLGRANKQLFVNATRPINPFTLEYFYKAVPFYKEGYDIDNTSVWHGINLASLLYLAKKEKIEVSGFPEPEAIAKDLLDIIDKKMATGSADGWDHATAGEANIILGHWNEALKNIQSYLNSSPDSFAIRGTLRQFREVLQLDGKDKSGGAILLALENALKTRSATTMQLKSMASSDYQKNFSDEKYKTLEWFADAHARSKAVARIGPNASTGEGTGFLMRGSALSSKLSDDFVLVTNAHVITDDEEVFKIEGIHPSHADDVVVIFEKINPTEEFLLDRVYWTSEPRKLDATIVLFNKKHISRINEIGELSEPFPVAKRLPIAEDPTQKVYIIGHPNGGTLSFSIDDNKMLDHEDPRIHYRTPSDPGSSGSPIFNRNWKLLGLHHKGSEIMQMLNNRSGTYMANEGIFIQTIINAVTTESK